MSNSHPHSSNQYRSSLYTFILFSIFLGILTIYLLIIGVNSVNVSIITAGIVTLVTTISISISAILIKRGRVSTGSWVSIITIATGVPITTLWISGLGWFGIFAIPITITIIASQTLDYRKLRVVVLIGLGLAVINQFLDYYGSPNRPSIPYIDVLFLVTSIILMLVIGILLARRFTSFTLQAKLLILFLAISLLPLGVLTYLNYRSTRNTLTDSANLSLYSTGTQTADQIDSFFENTKSTIQAEAQLTVLREYLSSTVYELPTSTEDATEALSILRSKDPNRILSYSLLNRNGDVMLHSPEINGDPHPFLGVNPAVENSFRTTMIDAHQYASPVLFQENMQPSIFFATAVYDINDDINPVGLLVIEYNATILQELMEEQNELAGVDSFGVLFDNYQIHLAHGTDSTTLFKTVASLEPQQYDALIEAGRLPDLPYEQLSTNLPDLSTKIKNSRDEPFFSAIDVATGDRINQVAVTNINTNPWQLGFFQPQDVYLAIVNQQTRDATMFLGIIAIIVTALSFGATRLISTPIVNLTNLVEHVAAGNLSLQVPVLTRDEIGRLALAFNALTAQIRSLLSGLELQVAKRTKELERQTVQLQTAAEVARDASNLKDLNELLERTVNLIHDRFGFYHAAIFLLDERNEFAVLRAANSEGGKAMIDVGHRLKVGETGIVGYVTSTGEPRIALDVGMDATHFAHPLLPNTRSEIALPLIMGGKITGALDVQSVEANAFDSGDITVLQVLADQLAVAIENTRLLTEVRQTVLDLQTAYGEFTQESWHRWVQHENHPTGFRYRGGGIEIATTKTPEAILALRQGIRITKANHSHSDDKSAMAIPIRLRNQTFGVINIQFESADIPTEMTTILDSISDRLAAALESARLYEEIQRRAAQEQISSGIASRFRESLDIDAVLKTAVQEIGEKFNLHDISIQIDTNGISKNERNS